MLQMPLKGTMCCVAFKRNSIITSSVAMASKVKSIRHVNSGHRMSIFFKHLDDTKNSIL